MEQINVMRTAPTFNGIPKIIHQTWKNKNVPLKWKESQEQWKIIHPDYLYVLWTDQDIKEYIEKYHPEFLELHDSYKHPIQRADLIRYFVLFDFGGIYSDLDIVPLKKIDPYITAGHEAYFIMGGYSNNLTNCFMISKKRSNVFLDIIAKLRRKIPWYIKGNFLRILYTTGPLLVSNVIKDYTESSVCILPRKLFYTHDAKTEDSQLDKNLPKNAVLKYLPGKSWNQWDAWVFNSINKYYYFYIMAILFTLLALILVPVGLLIIRRHKFIVSKK